MNGRAQGPTTKATKEARPQDTTNAVPYATGTHLSGLRRPCVVAGTDPARTQKTRAQEARNYSVVTGGVHPHKHTAEGNGQEMRRMSAAQQHDIHHQAFLEKKI